MNTKMYVGNLSYDATDSDICELFEAHDTVSDVSSLKTVSLAASAALLCLDGNP